VGTLGIMADLLRGADDAELMRFRQYRRFDGP
jgi:hypothetical protein